MAAVVGRSTGSLGSMRHWHPYAKVWAGLVVAVMLLYTLGSPVYWWATTGHISVTDALAIMLFAWLGVAAIGIPLLGVGAVLITIAARIANRVRRVDHHAA